MNKGWSVRKQPVAGLWSAAREKERVRERERERQTEKEGAPRHTEKLTVIRLHEAVREDFSIRRLIS